MCRVWVSLKNLVFCFFLLEGAYSSELSCALSCQESWWVARLLSRDLAPRLTLAGDPWRLAWSTATSVSPVLQFLGTLFTWTGARSLGDLPGVLGPCLTLCRHSQWISLERMVVTWPALSPCSVDQEWTQGWIFLMILMREFNNVTHIREQPSVLQIVPDRYGNMSMFHIIHMKNQRKVFKRLGLWQDF